MTEAPFKVDLVNKNWILKSPEKVYLLYLWTNPKPNSSRYCRVTSFCYKNKTKAVVQGKTQEIPDKSNKLEPALLNFDDKKIEIYFKMQLNYRLWKKL